MANIALPNQSCPFKWKLFFPRDFTFFFSFADFKALHVVVLLVLNSEVVVYSLVRRGAHRLYMI